MFMGTILAPVLVALGLLLGGAGDEQVDPWKKVEIDLSQIDDDGLRGPPDGKVTVSYEFCIPNTDRCKATVKKIDRSVQFLPGSRGRIGAQPGECLCIGTTRKGFRRVLKSLAELDYIKRIIPCYFE